MRCLLMPAANVEICFVKQSEINAAMAITSATDLHAAVYALASVSSR